VRRVGVGELLSEQRNLEMVRGMLASFSANFEQLKEGGLPPDFELFAPDVEFRHVDAFPTPIHYVGREHYRTWLEESLGGYTGVRWAQPELVANGDFVVALARLTGRPVGAAADEADLAVDLAVLHEIHDGRLTKLHIYLDRAAALRAAGITEG
jgi:ketosteroid isomerase-like protein